MRTLDPELIRRALEAQKEETAQLLARLTVLRSLSQASPVMTEAEKERDLANFDRQIAQAEWVLDECEGRLDASTAALNGNGMNRAERRAKKH